MQEVESLLARDAGLQKEFLDLVPPSHPHHPALLKIFRRRIKRTKKVLPSMLLPGIHVDTGGCTDESRQW